MAWLPQDKALSARETLRHLMQRFSFASCVPFANDVPLAGASDHGRTGLLFRAAAHEAVPDELIAQIEQVLGLDDPGVLRYADRTRSQRRAVRLQRNDEGATLEGFLLAGDASAEAWIKTLLQQELPAQSYGRLLLRPGAEAPLAVQSRGRQVCTCFNVSETAIDAHLAQCSGSESERLASLQNALQCGTNCGSCVPELQRLVRATPALQQAA